MEMSEYFTLADFNTDLLDTAIVKNFVSLTKLEYAPYWQNTLHHSQKLDFFRYFKSDHTTSNYLDLTRGTADRKNLLKLQMIELGIYNQTTRDTRNCPSLNLLIVLNTL